MIEICVFAMLCRGREKAAMPEPRSIAFPGGRRLTDGAPI